MSATCRSCGAPIRWERTVNGKAIPLDPDPVADGNFGIRNDGKVASIHGFPDDAPRYVTHFATCPNAAQHRGRPRS